MSSPVVIIVIGSPPPTKPQRAHEIPAVGDASIADMLRDAADVLDGKQE